MSGVSGKRIAVVTDHYSPQSSGGVERVVHEVALRLAGMGARLLIVTALRRGEQPFTDVPRCQVISHRIHDISHITRLQTGVAPASLAGMRHLLGAHDVAAVNVHGLHFQTSLGAALANARHRWPMVTTSHVASFDDLPQPGRAVTNAYEQSVGRFIIRCSDRMIAISESVRDHLVDLSTPRERIDMVPNGVDHDRFHPTVGDAAAGDGAPLIMFVGRHLPNKGPQVLVDALIELHRRGVAFHAEFLSTGPLRSSLEARIAQAGMSEAVAFRGHVPDVAVEMRRAAIIARPSFCEGLPLSLLEAMASGVAVIASDVGGNRDLVTDGYNGLMVPAGRANALADGLERLIRDHDLRQRVADQAHIDALAYTWERCAEGTAESLCMAMAMHTR